MGYQEDKLASAQKALDDYLSQGGTNIDSTIAKNKDYLAGLDTQKAANTQDLLGQVGGKFNLTPTNGGASDVTSALEPGIQARRDAALGQMKMQRTGDLYTKRFNQAFDSYQAAGYTRQQAEAFARDWAAQIQGENNSADLAQTSRDYRAREQAVANQNALRMNDLNQAPQNPYEAALYRSLFGLGTTALGYTIINGKKVPLSKGNIDPNAGPPPNLQ